MLDQTDTLNLTTFGGLSDAELIHMLGELARIESETSADQDCIDYWS
jgi:hypothetical protein